MPVSVLDSRVETGIVVEEFIKSQDVKRSSKKTYRESIERYLNWLQENGIGLDQVTEQTIINYKQNLIDTKHSILTVSSYIIAVRKFYAWAESRHLYANVAKSVKSPRRNQGGSGDHFLKMHLTDKQAAELLEYVKDKPRDYAIVNLMLRTGLRTIEVSRARVGDIKERAGRRILQVWGKGMDAPDPTVYVILTEATYGPIREYLAAREPVSDEDFLFTTEGKGAHRQKPHSGQDMSPRLIQMTVKNALRGIGLDSHAYSAHSLRHTTATQIIKNGGTIMDVKRTLRHSSVNTSMIYTSSIEEEERLKNSPESLLDRSFRKT